jgi:hypothetical protein
VLLVGGFNDATNALSSTERYMPPAACIPAKCEAEMCGVVSDGCGGLINCGPCTGGRQCGPGGCETGTGVDVSVLVPLPVPR